MSTVFPTFFIIIGIVAGIIGLNDILYKYKNKPFIYIFMTIYNIISIVFLTVFVVRPQMHPPRIRPPFSTPAPTLNTYTFNSLALEFPETLIKPVYTGPGTNYVRASNGKAQFSSREFIYGGRDGNWLFVRCTIKNGIRYGYIYAGDYNQTIRYVPTFQFSNASAVITRSTGIWDSLMDYNIGAVDNLYEGQNVTYLCNFNIDGRKLAYVEASTASGSVRGFVDPNCISFD